MVYTVPGSDIEERLATLEVRFEQLVGPLRPSKVASQTASAQTLRQTPLGAPPSGLMRAAGRGARSPGSGHVRTRQRIPSPPAHGPRNHSLADLVGGRLLAWLGGVAILLGIVLFLALAVSRGWIGEEARVVIAAAVSSALMAGGGWLHVRRGRTEAAKAIVGAATAALFCTLVVASQLYGLIPPLVAVGLSLLVGGVATTLAIRWAGGVVGALGLLGGLLSPALVGAPMTATTIAVLALACACAIGVVVRQRWSWLGLGGVLVCAPQWATWMLQGHAAAADLAVLGVFGALGLLGAVGGQRRTDTSRLPRGSAALAALSACLVAVIGHVALQEASGQAAAEGWVAALAAVHVIVGAYRFRRLPIVAPLRRVLLAIGVVLADVAFGLGASGVALAAGWAGAAVGFAWLARRSATHGEDEALVGLGLGAHVGLALIRVLIDVPVGALGASDAAVLPLVSVSALAASCLASAQLVGNERTVWRTALNGLGLAAVAYLTAAALNGPVLVCAWCAEAVALSRFTKAEQTGAGRYAMFGFLALAAAHVLVAEAPPSALVTGAGDLGGAGAGLGALALATFRAARTESSGGKLGVRLFGASATALVYLASVAIVTAFQPGAEAGTETVLDLTVRQEGQVLLSAMWSLVGLAALIVGLRRKQAAVRSVALGWLLISVAKVFLYDLSTLNSIYRVISFVVLGLLLLAGAYAYQRLRPPPLPDMRSVHPSQR